MRWGDGGRDFTVYPQVIGVGCGTNTAPTGDIRIKPRTVHASVSPHDSFREGFD